MLPCNPALAFGCGMRETHALGVGRWVAGWVSSRIFSAARIDGWSGERSARRKNESATCAWPRKGAVRRTAFTGEGLPIDQSLRRSCTACGLAGRACRDEANAHQAAARASGLGNRAPWVRYRSCTCSAFASALRCGMTSACQLLPGAVSSEIFAERWTIILRELVLGSRRFNEIPRGVPRISRALLAGREAARSD